MRRISTTGSRLPLSRILTHSLSLVGMTNGQFTAIAVPHVMPIISGGQTLWILATKRGDSLRVEEHGKSMAAISNNRIITTVSEVRYLLQQANQEHPFSLLKRGHLKSKEVSTAIWDSNQVASSWREAVLLANTETIQTAVAVVVLTATKQEATSTEESLNESSRQLLKRDDV